ncbi:MAG: hypothetical protein J0H80_21130 [Rhizobiales bacterium]|nr:hypothetical protein [Hyphomicrobiales bacterium]
MERFRDSKKSGKALFLDRQPHGAARVARKPVLRLFVEHGRKDRYHIARYVPVIRRYLIGYFGSRQIKAISASDMLSNSTTLPVLPA